MQEWVHADVKTPQELFSMCLLVLPLKHIKVARFGICVCVHVEFWEAECSEHEQRLQHAEKGNGE